MIFCYIDETGTPEIPGTSTHYVLAGLAIRVTNWKPFEFKIEALKKKYGLQHSEIHTAWILRKYVEQLTIPDFESLSWQDRTYEIRKYRNSQLIKLQAAKNSTAYRQAKKNYRTTDAYIHLTYSERRQFVLELAKLIRSWDSIRLFAECIDKIHFNPSASPRTVDEQAFEQIVSRFEIYLNTFSYNSKRKHFGLLVHDNNETTKNKLTALMKNFHSSGTLWIRIENIIETPMFVDSQLTSMIQIADLCSYALRRYLENQEEDLFDEIFQRADQKNGKVVGVRHFTNNNCNCKICAAHR